ncbi:MAG: cytochrome C [Gammaproteobacteria bacterium]|nr:MAG: cytochrome C [Gammaproteobacteria bacterium]
MPLFLLLFISCGAFSYDIDIEDGFDINETCAGCHGEFGEGGKDGEYPRIAGLSEAYIIQQLNRFQARTRSNIPMNPYTDERELSQADMQNVAAYLTQIKIKNKMPPIDENNFNAYERMLLAKQVLNIAKVDGDYKDGAMLYKKECAICHGKKGEGKKDIPALAGQYTQYLTKQIKYYNNRQRIHDEEKPDEILFLDFNAKQIHNILAYLSILDD